MNRRSLRDSIVSVNYAILAAVDTVNVWYALFPYYLQEVHGVYYTDLSQFTCTTGEVIQNTFLIFSALLISKMSVERFIGIYFPLASKSFLTKKNSIRVAAVIALCTFIMNSPSLVVARIRPHKDHSHCFVPEKYVYTNQTVLKVGSIFISYIPFIIIILANIGIIAKLTCLKDNLSQQTANVQATSITFSLLAVSFVFLILTSPITIINLAEPHFFPGYHPEVRGSLMNLYIVAAHATLLCNYGINFYIYISTGSTFRRELIAMLKEVVKFLSCGKCFASEGRGEGLSVSSTYRQKSQLETSVSSVSVAT